MDTRPCIAIDYAHLYGMGAGYGLFRYLVDLVRGLHRIQPDARFLLIGSALRPPAELEPVLSETGGTWRYVQTPLASGRAAMLRDQLPYARLLARESVSLFHSPYRFVPFMTASPTVITVHDLVWEIFPEHARAARALSWRMHRFAIRRTVARTIVNSFATAADVQQRWHPRPGSVAVVQLGTDFGRFADAPVERPTAAQLRDLPESVPIIATPYNLEPQKNFAALLHAVARLRESHPALRVVAFGRAGCIGTREEAVDRLLRELGLETLLIRTGLLSDADLAWLYGRADVCAFPSLYEGFGLPALEAMAVGGCVVARSASATKEVVGDGGILIEPMDADTLATAIDDLLRHPERGRALSARARQRAGAFTIERMAESTWNVYEEVLTSVRPADRRVVAPSSGARTG